MHFLGNDFRPHCKSWVCCLGLDFASLLAEDALCFVG